MSSLRPLFTVIILAAVATFLYVKINKAPVMRLADAGASTEAPPAAPPLAATAGATASAPAASSNAAPSWSGGQDASTKTATKQEPTRPAMPATPDLPPIPDLPELPQPVTEPAAAATAGSQSSANTSSSPVATQTAPSATSNVPPAARSEQDTAAENAMKAMGLTPSSVTSPSPAAGPSAPPSPVDRYGLSTRPPAPVTESTALPTAAPSVTQGLGVATNRDLPTTPANASKSFADAWPPIEMALQKGDLAQAHQMLSPWHGEPSLTPGEAQQIDKLLGQLAGTVIYSPEHRLEPPYTVRRGDTLESVARQHDVPWQLLAKINNVSAAGPLQPGQQLKVVRGPFEGVLDLRRSQLSLKVAGRYAGRFAFNAPTDAAVPPGEWRVLDKPVTPNSQASVYGSPTSAAPSVTRAVLLRSAAASATNPGQLIQIGATSAAIAPAMPGGSLREEPNKLPYVVQVSPRDAEDLADILSVGSRVMILR